MIGKAAAFLVTTHFALIQNYALVQAIHSLGREGAHGLISRQTSRRTMMSDRRNNFCEIAKQVQLGNVDMREALKGFNVSIGLQQTDKEQMEISKNLFDEISRRGQFHYKDSIEEVPLPTGNDTFTDALIHTLDNYDVAASWWIRSTERTALSITGVISWYDASTIMILKEGRSRTFHIAGLFEPFEWDVWGLIFGTVIVSGIAYYIIDYMIHHGNPESKDGIGDNLFKSALTFAGDNAFDPKFASNRILLVSMSFLSLILVAAYTANLASFLVAGKKNASIKNFDDVIMNKYNVCVYKGSANIVAIQNDYPTAEYVEKSGTLEVYQGLQNDDCQVALMSVDEHRGYENDKKFNKDCALEVVGTPVRQDSASFAVKSSVEHCSSLLRDVLDLFMLEIIHDGKLESIKKNSYQGSQKCGSSEVDDGSLTLNDLGGIFIIYYAMLVLAMILAALHAMCPNVFVRNLDKLTMIKAFSNFLTNKISRLFMKGAEEQHECDENDIEANEAKRGSPDLIQLSSNNQMMKEMFMKVIKMSSEVSEIKMSQEEMKKHHDEVQTSQVQTFRRRNKTQSSRRATPTTQAESKTQASRRETPTTQAEF